MKHEFSQYIKDPEELEEFLVWAFGKDYIHLTEYLDFMHAWNALHGDYLMLHEDSDLDKDILRMAVLWKHYGRFIVPKYKTLDQNAENA